MKAEKIKPGMLLRLKPDRQEAYGSDNPLVLVRSVSYHTGRKTPWITEAREWVDAQGMRQPVAFYRPSDFSGIAPR